MTFPRLTMTMPAQWPVPGLSLTIDPVVPSTGEDEVIAAALAVDLPPGTHLTPGDHHGGASIQGWPVRLIQGRVVDDAGAQKETRLIALYRMIDWLGVIRLVATDRAAWEAHRAAVLNAMMSGVLELGPGAGPATGP
ncbi:MAG: hypothetical protein K8W52_06150 [Deltaproteobacteria bacterium]|nr:hypothetical protein [Deltaproteobacteria bacterium]